MWRLLQDLQKVTEGETSSEYFERILVFERYYQNFIYGAEITKIAEFLQEIDIFFTCSLIWSKVFHFGYFTKKLEKNSAHLVSLPPQSLTIFLRKVYCFEFDIFSILAILVASLKLFRNQKERNKRICRDSADIFILSKKLKIGVSFSERQFVRVFCQEITAGKN